MGALVQTSRQTISQIERGDYSPSVTLALKIAKVCGLRQGIQKAAEVNKIVKGVMTKKIR